MKSSIYNLKKSNFCKGGWDEKFGSPASPTLLRTASVVVLIQALGASCRFPEQKISHGIGVDVHLRFPCGNTSRIDHHLWIVETHRLNVANFWEYIQWNVVCPTNIVMDLKNVMHEASLCYSLLVMTKGTTTWLVHTQVSAKEKSSWRRLFSCMCAYNCLSGLKVEVAKRKEMKCLCSPPMCDVRSLSSTHRMWVFWSDQTSGWLPFIFKHLNIVMTNMLEKYFKYSSPVNYFTCWFMSTYKWCFLPRFAWFLCLVPSKEDFCH